MSRRVHFTLTSIVLMAGFVVPMAAGAQSSSPVGQSAVLASGSLGGTVSDTASRPLPGAVVSALGPETVFAVTDDEGRFEFLALRPGAYMLRAHLTGFGTSRREIVDIHPNARESRTVTLQRTILAAGFAQPIEGMEDAPAEPLEPATTLDHTHGERAWRIRHLRRSVLRDTAARVPFGDDDPPESDRPAAVGRALESPARLAAALFSEFPFSGEVNLLTTANVDQPGDRGGSLELPRGVAFVTIGAPAGSHGDWAVQAAVTQGDIESWILAGSYTSRAPSVHAFDVGLSYGTQEYGGGNPAALAAVTDGSRNVGAVHAFDRWTVSRHVALSYGGRYAWYDYLESPGLLSPRAAVTVSPGGRTRVSAVVSQRMIAPGAEEFLPPDNGLWLPPERTFAPMADATGFRAERARHVELGVEQGLGDDYAVGVRRFYQDVSDQIATLFGVNPLAHARVDVGHYYVTNAGHVTTDGWTLSIAGTMARRVRGTVEYSRIDALWRGSPELQAAAAVWAPALLRPDAERFHDVTTMLDAEIPETHTRVHLVYKINSAFTGPEADAARSGRFDFQLKQALPFLTFTSTQWEFLVAVRNLFRDPDEAASVYDELLVLRPPTRIVGGLLVRF